MLALLIPGVGMGASPYVAPTGTGHMLMLMGVGRALAPWLLLSTFFHGVLHG